MNTNAIQYQLLEPRHKVLAVNLIREVFTKKEPITSHLGVSTHEFEPFVKDLVSHAIQQRLSWVALDKATKKIAGARITTDYAKDFLPGEYGENMNIVGDFLNKVAHSNRISHKKTVHSHMVAVDPQYARLGIAKNLLGWASSWAYSKGYRYSVGEVTNQNNRKLLEQIPSYQALHRVEYKSYSYKGKRPFLTLNEHDACVLFRFHLEDFFNRKQCA